MPTNHCSLSGNFQHFLSPTVQKEAAARYRGSDVNQVCFSVANVLSTRTPLNVSSELQNDYANYAEVWHNLTNWSLISSLRFKVEQFAFSDVTLLRKCHISENSGKNVWNTEQKHTYELKKKHVPLMCPLILLAHTDVTLISTDTLADCSTNSSWIHNQRLACLFYLFIL